MDSSWVFFMSPSEWRLRWLHDWSLCYLQIYLWSSSRRCLFLYRWLRLDHRTFREKKPQNGCFWEGWTEDEDKDGRTKTKDHQANSPQNPQRKDTWTKFLKRLQRSNFLKDLLPVFCKAILLKFGVLVVTWTPLLVWASWNETNVFWKTQGSWHQPAGF